MEKKARGMTRGIIRAGQKLASLGSTDTGDRCESFQWALTNLRYDTPTAAKQAPLIRNCDLEFFLVIMYFNTQNVALPQKMEFTYNC
jgi:hypothetical protein